MEKGIHTQSVTKAWRWLARLFSRGANKANMAIPSIKPPVASPEFPRDKTHAVRSDPPRVNCVVAAPELLDIPHAAYLRESHSFVYPHVPRGSIGTSAQLDGKPAASKSAAAPPPWTHDQGASLVRKLVVLGFLGFMLSSGTPGGLNGFGGAVVAIVGGSILYVALTLRAAAEYKRILTRAAENVPS